MENFQISSKVLKVTTIRSWSLWIDSSLADSSCRDETVRGRVIRPLTAARHKHCAQVTQAGKEAQS